MWNGQKGPTAAWMALVALLMAVVFYLGPVTKPPPSAAGYDEFAIAGQVDSGMTSASVVAARPLAVKAVSRMYDARAVPRALVHAPVAYRTIEALATAAPVRSDPPSAEAQGARTTFFARSVATNTAGEAATTSRSLVPYEAYPPKSLADRGFLGSWSTEETIQPGSVVSRYGRPSGTFVSPQGTPFAARGLPPAYEAFGESLYEVAQPITVQAGLASYWQGGGFGIQYDLPGSIQSLLDSGVLKVHTP